MDDLYSTQNAEQILRKARALLDDPRNWTTEAKARSSQGEPVHPADPRASCWCIEAAVGISANSAGIVPIPLLDLLDDVAIELFPDELRIQHKHFGTNTPEEPIWDHVAYEPVSYVNDHIGHRAVLLVLDRAIEHSCT